MSGNRMKAALLRACAYTAIGVTLAGGAQAQTQVYGGGSTLAAPTYNAEFTAYRNTIDPAINFNYAADGSGAGLNAFLPNDPTAHVGAGFPAGATIAFGAADNFLSAAQISAWSTSAAGQSRSGNLIQLPMFGTAITIPYRLTTQRGNGSITLTDDQLCGIFSGRITDFGDPRLAGINATGNPPTGNITVVYRIDGSGTSFLLTQHLAAVCNASNSNITWAASTTFLSNFGGVPPGAPATFTGATGSGGVQSTIQAALGTIGYLSPDYTQIAAVHTGDATFPVVSSLRNAGDGVVYTPTVTATRNALSTAAAPTTQADLANPALFSPSIPQPGTGYPIVGYTNWDVAQCYADPNVALGVAEFLFSHYTLPSFTNTINQNGFSLVPNDFLNAVTNNLLLNNNGYNLDIGNATACAGIGR